MNELINRPQHKPEQELKDDFVIRMLEYDKIMQSINSDAVGKIPQHLILQGQRGMGKTTLMYRVYYELLSAKRSEGVIPVVFSEEQYGVRSLYKLWEHIAVFLDDNEEDYVGILQELEDASERDDYEEVSFEILKRRIVKNNHRIILFIDNFGVMLDKFKKQEQQYFREILTTFPAFKIIGGTTVVLESFFRYDRPFFDFFKVMQLNPLSQKEVRVLLLRLGEKHKTDQVKHIIETQPGRVEAMRLLTGGVPRTIALLFNVFLDNNKGSSIQDLTYLLDRVTWLYKHRMDDLPPQQQEIVDKLALNWDGMSVAELVKKTRMESKAISSQLNNLVKSGVVSASRSSGKKKFYQIQERFFNIWYLMQHAPKKSRQRVVWLTRFLEQWCPGKMLNETATTFTLRLRKEVLDPQYISTMAQAYAQADGLSLENRDDLLKAAKESLNQLGEPMERYGLPDDSGEISRKVGQLIAEKKYDEAESLLNSSTLPEAMKCFGLGLIAQYQGKTDSAIKQYSIAIEKGNSVAMSNLALLYKNEKKDIDKAEKYYLMAIEKGNSDSMFNLALLYQNEKRDIDKAEKYYLMAIEKGHSMAMNNLAVLYKNEKKDLKKAEKYYLMAIEKEDSSAMYNLAKLALEQNWVRYKDKTLAWVNKRLSEVQNMDGFTLQVALLLWNDRIDEAIIHLEKFLEEFCNDGEEQNAAFGGTLVMAMAKGLLHYCHKLFLNEKYRLKDRYKVLYYALMKLLEDEYPDEILKMGSELKEPVNEMVDTIKEWEKRYA